MTKQAAGECGFEGVALSTVEGTKLKVNTAHMFTYIQMYLVITFTVDYLENRSFSPLTKSE